MRNVEKVAIDVVVQSIAMRLVSSSSLFVGNASGIAVKIAVREYAKKPRRVKGISEPLIFMLA